MVLGFRERGPVVVCGGVTRSSWEGVIEALEGLLSLGSQASFNVGGVGGIRSAEREIVRRY